jgi:hypothetical protein
LVGGVAVKLRAGANYYEHRNHTDDPGPVWVKRKETGEVGYVTRSCPSGNHIPACAHIMFGNEDKGYYGEWVAARDLERAYA